MPDEAGAAPEAGARPSVSGAHGDSTVGRLLVVLAVLPGVAAAVLATPGQARADAAEEVIRSRYLTLVSIGDNDRMTNLAPDQPVPWQVGVSAHAKQPGEVTISLRRWAPSPSGPTDSR